MLATQSARAIRCDVAEMVRAPRPIPVSQSVARNLRVVNPAGSGGRVTLDLTPYMAEPSDLISSRAFEAVIFGGPARSGKTIFLIDGTVAYSVVDDPADTLIVQTNESQAHDYSKTRMKRGIAASPELAKRLSPRAHDDNVTLKMFRNGMALRFGWPTLAQLSGKDLRRVLMTDVDNFTGDLSIDEAFGLALKRVQTYLSSGVCVAESSPARDFTDVRWQPRTPHEMPPAPGIASLYNSGDRRRWYWCCPECKQPFQAAPGIAGFVLPSFEELVERVVADDVLKMAEQYSLLHCTECGVAIEHRWKRAMNAGAHWVGEGQRMWPDGTITGERLRSRRASFWLGGVAAAYQTWTSLIERHLQAVKAFALTGDSKALKTTANVDQAMPFVPIAARTQRSEHDLQTRAEAWPQGYVPEGVRFLTAQVDIQAGQRARFVIQVQGWGTGPGGGTQNWTIDRYALKSSARPTGAVDKEGKPEHFPIDPASYLEDWDRLIEKVINRRYPLADGSGRTLPIRMTCCDSGGKAGVTARAYEFWRRLRRDGLHGRFRLVKGGSEANAPRMQEVFPDVRGRNDRKSGAAGDVPVLLLNTDIVKDAVMANAWRDRPGPGYSHFPAWLPTSFYEELTAETRGDRGWKNLNGRANETLDLFVYAYAALLKLSAEKIDWNAPPFWAQTWDMNPDIGQPQGAPVAPVVQQAAARPRAVMRSSYVGRR